MTDENDCDTEERTLGDVLMEMMEYMAKGGATIDLESSNIPSTFMHVNDLLQEAFAIGEEMQNIIDAFGKSVISKQAENELRRWKKAVREYVQLREKSYATAWENDEPSEIEFEMDMQLHEAEEAMREGDLDAACAALKMPTEARIGSMKKHGIDGIAGGKTGEVPAPPPTETDMPKAKGKERDSQALGFTIKEASGAWAGSLVEPLGDKDGHYMLTKEGEERMHAFNEGDNKASYVRLPVMLDGIYRGHARLPIVGHHIGSDGCAVLIQVGKLSFPLPVDFDIPK